MLELSIDIETYSSEDLTKTGVYRYAGAPDFAILLFGYAFGNEGIQLTDLAQGETLPREVWDALLDPEVIKTAYNANFERTCLAAYFHQPMPPEQWACTMVRTAELGLPTNLKETAAALGLEGQKDARGRALIQYFSKPCRPTKANGGRTRNLPQHAPEKWAEFCAYCKQDVAVERAVKERLDRFPLWPKEQRLWEVDQRIVDRGVRVDETLVKNAMDFSGRYQGECLAALQRITGVENARSVVQLKAWAEERTGEAIESLDKKAVRTLQEKSRDPVLQEALRLRAETAKTSVKKYEAAARCTCRDGRLRGLVQFYGANRTGRWAGRLLQVQNLPQNHLPDLALARELVRQGDYDTFTLLYSTPQTLSELIRTALIPSEGRRFVVSDFSAIEARVLAYLAGEDWRMEVFRQGGDIYCASASRMFHVPVVKHGVNGHLRQKGKIAELALGYGGGVGALKSMGALEMGVPEEELPALVDSWRQANHNVTKFWRRTEQAAKAALEGKEGTLPHGLQFYRRDGVLFCQLPSGRAIAYADPQLRPSATGGTEITYLGMETGTRRWARLSTWGGKLVENIVQAVARDCLAESIFRLEKRGYPIVFHVHDEVILDLAEGISSAEEVAEIMGEPIGWAPGLLLKAEAYETPFYRKD